VLQQQQEVSILIRHSQHVKWHKLLWILAVNAVAIIRLPRLEAVINAFLMPTWSLLVALALLIVIVGNYRRDLSALWFFFLATLKIHSLSNWLVVDDEPSITVGLCSIGLWFLVPLSACYRACSRGVRYVIHCACLLVPKPLCLSMDVYFRCSAIEQVKNGVSRSQNASRILTCECSKMFAKPTTTSLTSFVGNHSSAWLLCWPLWLRFLLSRHDSRR